MLFRGKQSIGLGGKVKALLNAEHLSEEMHLVDAGRGHSRGQGLV
jgi:hypothetical protein